MKMEKPTVEAVRSGSRDVIATSGWVRPDSVTLSGFGDRPQKPGAKTNNTFQIGNVTNGPGSSDDFGTMEKFALALNGTASTNFMFFGSNGISASLEDLWTDDDKSWTSYNGEYTWRDIGSGYNWYWDKNN